MKNNNFNLYIILGLISAVVIFAVQTIQIKLAHNDDLGYLSDIISVVFGATFGFLIARVKILGQKVDTSAVTDQLTRLYNRSWLNNQLQKQHEQYQRYQTELSILLLNIDKFKNINETYGHHAGDEVLVKVAQLIRESSRTTDAYGRWSGEEFLILLPNTSLEGAQVKADAIRKRIADEIFSIGQVTCCVGVTEITSTEQQPHDLIKMADNALYEAKSIGKNRVCAVA